MTHAMPWSVHKTEQFVLKTTRFNEFLRKWVAGDFPHLRLGQAFVNFFELHKMTSFDHSKIYELDGKAAMQWIEANITLIR